MLRLSDILGQPAAIEWITRAYRADRLPHGLIFAGPRGVGKGTAARALATLFLCHAPIGIDPCGACDSCRLMAAGNHPDFAAVYRQLVRLEKSESKAKDLSVDVVRKYLIEPANLKPALNHGRVFVVEEAETMNAAAQNSLLKTLEEPFGRTLIVLLSDQPESLLPTIRSRAQVVRFGALDVKLVSAELAQRNIDPRTAEQAARMSEGSLGLALKWIEDGVIEKGLELGRLLDDLLSGRAAAAPPGAAPDLADWFKAAADAYAEKQEKRDPNVSLDQTKREGLSLYLHLAGLRFRRLLRDAAGTPRPDAAPGTAGPTDPAAPGAPVDPARIELACDAIDAIARADDLLDANVNIPIVFQQLSLTLKRVCA